MRLKYIANETRTRRKFWSVERRARRAAKEALSGLDPKGLQGVHEMEVSLSTGEWFVVTVEDGEIMSIVRIS